LFVSHNRTIVEALCPRSIYLVAGELANDAGTDAIVEEYLEQRQDPARNADARKRPVESGLVLERVSHSPQTIRSGDAADIEIHFQAETVGRIRECAVLIYSVKGMRVAVIDPRESGILPLRYQKGHFSIVIRIASLPLVEGDFTIGVYLVTDHFVGDLLELDEFTVLASRRELDFAPYPADACGVLVLNAASSVVSHRPVEAAR
jgi:homopolymeric O-antigen transport system ATP-binding protein